MIGADGNRRRRLFQNGGVVHALVGQLRLGAVPKDGAGDDLRAVLRQQIGDAVGLGAVDDDALQSELLGDTDGGGDVVRPVGVDVDGKFPPKDREQRLQLQVKFRGIGVLVRGSTVLFSRYSRALNSSSRITAAVAMRVIGVSCRSL